MVSNGEDTATSSTATVTGVGIGSANVLVTLNDTDADGNPETLKGSTTVNVSAAPVDYNHIKSVTVSPVEIDVTSGDAINQVYTSSPSPSDDGSYTYSWHWSKSSAGTITPSSDGKTATVTGTAPSTAGTYIVVCDVTDSYGTKVSSTSAYGKIVVSAAVEEGTLIPANCSLEQLDTYADKKAGYVECTVTVDEADDGTYQYYWYANGNGTGLGNVLSESGSTITSTWVTGAGTVKIGGTSYNKAGTVNYSVKVKDSHGNEYDSSQLNWLIS
ncbi:hypothetical protein M5Y73_18260 [Citrobacter cronae]|nr:hypothetical protein [Citrobacter cronae]